MHKCVVCMEARGQCPISFSIIPHLIFEMGSLTGLELDSARLDGQTVAGSLLPLYWDYRHVLPCLALLHASGDSNFWSSASTASAFLTGPPPQPT